MSAITTHILDTARGRPAAGIAVTLEGRAGGGWKVLGRGKTDADGRVRDLLAAGSRLEPGPYRLTFEVAPYFRAQNIDPFYPEVAVVFEVRAITEHYHVPLLLSPYGYTTYRGS